VAFDDYDIQPETAKVFYIGINYAVHNEDEFHYNGVNYRLVTLVFEDNTWRIAEFSDAPVERLQYLGYSFNSADEQRAAAVEEARFQGQIINLEGKVLSTNIADINELRQLSAQHKAVDSAAEAVVTSSFPRPPARIKVLMTKTGNLRAYGCASQCVRELDFSFYIKNVLPNE
jgi:hypothetical protein